MATVMAKQKEDISEDVSKRKAAPVAVFLLPPITDSIESPNSTYLPHFSYFSPQRVMVLQSSNPKDVS